MHFDKELVSIQYSLALLIGQDLQVVPMLKKFLPTALKLLGCSGGGVWFKKNDGTSIVFEHPAYSYPTLRPENIVRFSDLIAHMNTRFGGLEELPTDASLVETDGAYFYVFPMAKVGVLSLRRSSILHEKYVQALAPIIDRLSTACTACLEHEALIGAQQTAIESMRKAEEANNAKTEFLSTMSHELRTPLHGVLGLVSLTLDTELTAEQKDNLKSAKSSANSLLAIIDEILDMSQIEARTLRLNRDKFQLQPLLENTLRAFAIRAADKGLSFQSDICLKTNCFVEADSNRLKQVLIVLLDNALKYTSKGGVTFSVKADSVGKDQLALVFSVTDTGIGISKFDQEKIFASFTQAEGSLKRKYSGVGLGLAISSQLTELMGGKVEVESELGKGSTFTLSVVLKLVAAQAHGYSKPIFSEEDIQIRVLLAEDNPVNRKVAQKVLEKGGHQVILAHDGKQAVERWRLERPDLILMDLQMPEMDGLEATCIIRKEEQAAGTHIPIIALTANAREADQQACFDVGMDYFVAKPFSPRVLLGLIQKAILDVSPSP